MAVSSGTVWPEANNAAYLGSKFLIYHCEDSVH